MAEKIITAGQVSENRRARHDYAVEDTVEAGLLLMGSEVKSLRQGQASIVEAYAGPRKGELYLINANIPEYRQARENHEPKRPRKLLLRRREIDRLMAAVQREGMTLVPLKLYFNDRGIAKLLLGLAKGRKTHDKRQAIKARDWGRQKARIVRDLS